MSKRRVIANVVVGKPDVRPSKPSHVPGVRSGNSTGSMAKQRGIEPDGLGAKANPSRSTGINPKSRSPVDPRSPTLSPA